MGTGSSTMAGVETLYRKDKRSRSAGSLVNQALDNHAAPGDSDVKTAGVEKSPRPMATLDRQNSVRKVLTRAGSNLGFGKYKTSSMPNMHNIEEEG